MEKDGKYIVKLKYNLAFDDNCTISVAPWSNWNKMLVRITKYSNYGDWCLSMSQGKVGNENQDRIEGFADRYCTSHLPWTNYQFIVEKLYMNFTKHSSRVSDIKVFECVITVFKDEGSCDDYKCDNSRCIPNDLKCSNYNPCGDSSDCRKYNHKNVAALFGKVVGIIIGVAAGVVMLMICVKCCMASVGKENDGWESESRPPMEVERTPSLHESDWESETRDADRFYNDSLGDSDWRDGSLGRGRRYDSDESLELHPFYTSDGRTRTPIYESRDEQRGQTPNRQENTNRNNLREENSHSSATPSAAEVNDAQSSPAHSSETEGIEMTDIIVHDSNSNNMMIPSDLPDYELPPPSYESVMANSNHFAANS